MNLPSFLRQPAGPVLAFWMALVAPAGAQSQWIAFNDHYRGPNTGSKVSAWTVYTTVGGAPVGGPPGNFGFLTNSVSGTALPVTFTVTNVDAAALSAGRNAGGPDAGTPAAMAFTGYIDFGLDTVSNAIQLASSSRVAHIFAGCDTTRRYSWRGTAVRANNYADRWTLVEIAAAASTPAHAATPVALRTYFTTADILALTASQVVCNFGENRAAGMLAGWDDIQPNPDGTIVIYSSTWRGTMPAGYSSAPAGTYGYAIAADRLEEFLIGQPFAPTNQNVNLPADASVPGCSTLVLASSFTGSPAPTYLWYKDGAPMDTIANPSAATAALSLNNIQPGAAGTYHVRVSNASGTAVSRDATVTVRIQPHLVSVVAQSSDASSFLFTFDVPVVAPAFDYFVTQFVSRNGVAADLGLSAAAASQTSPTTVVVTSRNPREPGVNYLAKITSDENGVTDQCAGLNLAATNMNVVTEVALADYDNAADLWSYDQSGADLGTAWRAPGYNDSAWPTGPAPFGLETTAGSILVGPIRTPWMTNTTKLTFYLRKSANVPAPPSQIISLTLVQQVDDGDLTYINGIEVDRFGFAAGVTVTNTSLSAQAANEPVPLRTNSIAVTNLIEGRNAVAVEVHQTSTTSTDILYGSKLTAICSTIYPGVTITQSGNVVTVSWSEYGVNGQLQTSSDLVNWVTDGRPPTPGPSVNTYSLSYTLPVGSGRLFIRLRQ